MDADFDKVILLLKGDGSNNYPFVIDSSGRDLDVFNAVSTILSTARSKFYSASIYFNGSSGYLKCDAVCPLLVNVDYTIEGWFYKIGDVTGNDALFGFHASTGATNIEVFTSSSTTSMFGSTFSTTNYSSAIPTGQWFHFAVCRESDEIRVYLNGVNIATVASSGYGVTSTSLFSIGQEYDSGPVLSDYFYGNLNDFRITAGLARYTADFTPPGSLFGTLEGTILDRNGDPCAREVCAVPHGLPGKAWRTTSNASTGAYSLVVPKCEVSRIVMADDSTPLQNDIVDRVLVY